MTSAAPGLRVLLADDAVVIREGIARVLTDTGLQIVGQVSDADALLAAVPLCRPDVVICDIRMPPTYTLEGLHAAQELRAHHPDVGVLILSHHIDLHTLTALFGGHPARCGYLLKERLTELTELTDAIARIEAGGTVVDALLVSQLLNRPRRRDPLATLSPRERDVLALIAEGRSNTAIADRLYLGRKTVETHIRGVFTKLQLPGEPNDHRRVLAALTYLRALKTEPTATPPDR